MFWQIAGTIIAVISIGIPLWLYFWSRRERIKINIHKPSYTANEGDKVLRVFWSCELQRLGGEEVRYVAKICLKPDAQIYRQLQRYFKLPEDRVIINERLELARGKIVSTDHGVDTGTYPEYDALMKTSDLPPRQAGGHLPQPYPLLNIFS